MRKVVDELDVGIVVDDGGASGIRFAATSLSKSVFLPCVRSSVQWPNEECTLNTEVFLAGWMGTLLDSPCAKGAATFVESSETVLPLCRRHEISVVRQSTRGAV